MKIPRHYNLTEVAIKLLGLLAKTKGISQTAVLETLVREEAKREGIRIQDLPTNPTKEL